MAPLVIVAGFLLNFKFKCLLSNFECFGVWGFCTAEEGFEDPANSSLLFSKFLATITTFPNLHQRAGYPQVLPTKHLLYVLNEKEKKQGTPDF